MSNTNIAVKGPSAKQDTRGSSALRRGPMRRPAMAYVLVILYTVVSTYPLLWMVLQTFRSEAEMLAKPWGVPLKPGIDAYLTVFREVPFGQYIMNSVLVTLATVVISVAACVGAGYAFSRLRFPGSDKLMAVFIGVLVVPAPILLLPVFLISLDLGILNSYIGLIAPYAAGNLPIGVYLVKTHFDGIPVELVEAAEIDGASPWRTFLHVMAPLVGPAASVVAVLAFMGAWNEYVYAVMALSDSGMYTLPVGVADLGSKSFLYGRAPVFAAMLISALPVYVAFFLAQRSFVAAFSIGGSVKG